ncbi:hypothetical protein L3Y34_006066 [Caenorhabditis briggsae]|uniref:Uncharacterized protein n=2 Tax=Caenorhabditis briggsae TaxID=6238 RepID=A0AAE9CXZ8_CAEBR|nr:hypothetical protein L3Y34_006066 [Caenorhabditis briggsae]
MIHARNSSFDTFSLLLTDSSEVTVEQIEECCEGMALSDIFPIFMVAGAIWVLVYCILMTQKIFMDSQYQEIQPKRNGEEDDVEHLHPPPSPRHPRPKRCLDDIDVEQGLTRNNDQTPRAFFPYYL